MSTTSIQISRDRHERLKRWADERGMILYRVVDAMVEGWDMLTEEQRSAALLSPSSNARRSGQPSDESVTTSQLPTLEDQSARGESNAAA